ncbi:response regulator [Paenibacillus chartarius]|uniref:Response regulator n=1 Tax=Paenibacillus chartarius TaxID=747481 RepID=A0ABV6DI89_9BACL
MNVIIVDDEEFIRLGIAKILSKSELPVHIAGLYANGMEAWAELSKLAPGELDVLITDIKMPVMDGLRLIEKVKEKMPDLPVIILSGFNEFEYARQALRFGVTDYFLKPLDKYELCQALWKLYHMKEETAPEDHQQVVRGQEHYVVERIRYILEKEYDKPFNLEKLAERVELSPSYVSKFFRQQTGSTVTDFLMTLRIEKAKQFMADFPKLKNYEIAGMVGYSDPVYFNKLFKKITGVTPKEYKERN